MEIQVKPSLPAIYSSKSLSSRKERPAKAQRDVLPDIARSAPVPGNRNAVKVYKYRVSCKVISLYLQTTYHIFYVLRYCPEIIHELSYQHFVIVLGGMLSKRMTKYQKLYVIVNFLPILFGSKHVIPNNIEMILT